jgi:hypothetical protein
MVGGFLLSIRKLKKQTVVDRYQISLLAYAVRLRVICPGAEEGGDS